MSKWKEWINLIPEGVKNLSGVVDGILTDAAITLHLMDEDKRDEIVKRRIICAGCPFMSERAKTSQEYLEVTGHHYKTKRTDEHCSFCGCPIKTRTASLSANCGISSWNKKNPEKQLPLKWEAYKSPEDESD